MLRTLTRAVMTVMVVVGALAGAPAAVADEAPAPVAGVAAEAPAEAPEAAPEGPGQTAPTGGTGDAAEAADGAHEGSGEGPAGDGAGDLADDAPAPAPAPVPETPGQAAPADADVPPEAPAGPGEGPGDAPVGAPEGPAEGDGDPLPGEPGQLTPYAPGPDGRTRIREILPECPDAQASGCYDTATGGGRWISPDGSRAYTWDDGRLLVLSPDGTSAPATDEGGYWVLRVDGTLYLVPPYAEGEAIEAAQCEAAVAAGVLPAGSCDAAEGAEGADGGDGEGAVRGQDYEGPAQDASGGDTVTDGYVASTGSEPAQVVTGGSPVRLPDTGGSGGLVVLAAELVAGGLALVWLVRRSR